MKICDDLRLLGLLGEVRIPGLQAGSSIMPGKVNPVLLEAAIQVGMKVMANDALITDACSRGSLQINEFLPLVSFCLHESLELLTRVDMRLSAHVAGIAADEKRCRTAFERSPMIVTALLPHIGYERATRLVEEFLRSGGDSIVDFLADRLGSGLVEEVLSPQKLVALGYKDGRA